MAKHKPKPWHISAWQMYQSGKSVKEIAAVLGYSVNQVAVVIGNRRDQFANLTTEEQWFVDLTKAAVQGLCAGGLPDFIANIQDIKDVTVAQVATAIADEAARMVALTITRTRELAQQEAVKQRVNPIAQAEREIAQRHTGAGVGGGQ
jgi:hypothetical protein